LTSAGLSPRRSFRRIASFSFKSFFACWSTSGLVVQSVRPRRPVEAENSFLRRDLALDKVAGQNPDASTPQREMSLAFIVS
jgi:hypothetical protein